MINVGCRIDRIRTFCVIRGQHAFYKNREKRGTLSYKKRKNRGTTLQKPARQQGRYHQRWRDILFFAARSYAKELSYKKRKNVEHSNDKVGNTLSHNIEDFMACPGLVDS